MSRIGRKVIPVPAGVDVKIDGQRVEVKGPKGSLHHVVAEPISVERDDDGSLTVVRPNDERRAKELHGLSRTLVANMVVGVTEGYKKDLEILGVGYRAALDGKVLVLSVGFSHPVRMDPPEGISYQLDGNTKVAVLGIDKQAVGEEAARIRRVRPPEPYKGKGIRYAGEVVRRKAGKAGKAGKK